MNEEERKLVEKLALKQATYSIDAIDCPNMIILRSELKKVIEIVYNLQNRIDKAIEYIEKFSDPSIGVIKKILKESGE